MAVLLLENEGGVLRLSSKEVLCRQLIRGQLSAGVVLV